MNLRRVVGVSAVLCALIAAGSAWGAPPTRMAALGDSLTTGYGSSGPLANNPSGSWSTGSDTTVNSHAQRLGRLTTAIFGNAFNDAAAGSKVGALPGQAATAVGQGAQYVTVLSGTNDVCAVSSVGQMTSVASYGASLNQALTTLSNGLPSAGKILVATIPDWLKLREALKDNATATSAWAANNVCPLIFAPSTSGADRAAAAQRIADYNSQAQTECAKFAKCVFDGGAVFDLTFAVSDLAPDFFHFSLNGQAALAATTWAAGPYAGLQSEYDSLFGCGRCLAIYEHPTLTATIASASNSRDFAGGSKQLGASGVSGRLFTRTVFSLAPGQTLGGKLHVLEVQQPNGSILYELILTKARELALQSPAGALRATALTLRTGVVIPNDGSTTVIETSALAHDSVIVRVNGTDRASQTGLSGGTSGNQRALKVGIIRYDGTATNSVQVKHSAVGTSTTNWLGPPGGTDTTPPGVPGNFTATLGATQVDLGWVNPNDADLHHVRIVRKAGAEPQNPTDGTIICDCTGTQATDSVPPDGGTFHYAAFAVDASGNHSAPARASVTDPAEPGGDDVYDLIVTDSGCSACTFLPASPGYEATIAGGDGGTDTAFGRREFGGSGGVSGRLFTRTTLLFPAGQQLSGNLPVFQLRDTNDALVFQIVLTASREVRFTSPAGGLRSTSITVNTGKIVPNDGATSMRVEVSALRNDSVTIRIDDDYSKTLGGFSGAATTNPRSLHAGILSYGSTVANEQVKIRHHGVNISTTDWLG